MSKESIVASAVSAIQAGEEQVLKDNLASVYDQAALEQKAADGTMSQADVDAAVAIQIEKDASAAQVVLNDALIAAHAESDAAIAAMQLKLDEMSGKLGVDEKIVSDLNAAMEKIQSSLDTLKSLFPTV